MNILPHKSWHVRTKKNIARVRKDEREAAEKEQERLRRVQLAEQEAKITLLRSRAKEERPDGVVVENLEVPNNLLPTPSHHVNFFNELEAGKNVSTKTNVEHEKEKKQEQEKYEKQVGYLTYLGQDTNEALGKRDWYESLPNRKKEENKVEVGLKMKMFNDPLAVMERYLGKSLKSSISKEESVEETNETTEKPSTSKVKKYESILGNIKFNRKRKRSSSSDRSKSPKKKRSKSKKSKHKKSKKHKKNKKRKRETSSSSTSSESEDEAQIQLKKQKLEKLRAERLERERVEKYKADKLLGLIKEEEPKKVAEKPIVRQKYNSQFNPEIARQNID
jgi:hypothetical protein